VIIDNLRLVKASLLYADTVTLCSPATSLVLGILGLRQYSLPMQIDLIQAVAPIVLPERAGALLAGIPKYHMLKQKRRRTSTELIELQKFEAAMRRSWEDVRALLDNMIVDTYADGMIEALETGVLKLNQFKLANPTAITAHVLKLALGQPDTSTITDEFMDIVKDTMNDSYVYPLFDDMVGNLVRLGLDAGQIQLSRAQIAKGKQSGLAANLLERLPLFEDATVGQIMLVRKELDRYLTRFRAAVIRFSERIQVAPWDSDFPYEVEETFRRDVAPAVLDIEDALKSGPVLKEILGKLFDKQGVIIPGSAALTAALSKLVELPHVAAVALTGSMTVANAGKLVLDVQAERRQKEEKASQNQLYFYYRAGHRLQQRA